MKIGPRVSKFKVGRKLLTHPVYLSYIECQWHWSLAYWFAACSHDDTAEKKSSKI